MPEDFITPRLRAARTWQQKIDELALVANEDLEAAGQADATIADSLLAIASQLAYGNAVDAATFYLENRLWISL